MAVNRWVAITLGVALAAGCTTYTRHECWCEPAVEVRLRVVHADGGPAESLISVRGVEAVVLGDAAGRAVFTIPACSGGRAYVDRVLVREEDPQRIPAAWLWAEGRGWNALSVMHVDALPVDGEGYHVFVLEA